MDERDVFVMSPAEDRVRVLKKATDALSGAEESAPEGPL